MLIFEKFNIFLIIGNIFFSKKLLFLSLTIFLFKFLHQTIISSSLIHSKWETFSCAIIILFSCFISVHIKYVIRAPESLKNLNKDTNLLPDGLKVGWQRKKSLSIFFKPHSLTAFSIERINFFRRLPNLSYVNIPDSVKFIGSGAFYKCTKLKNVVIGNSVTYIGRSAFQGCDIETLYLPDSIYKIEQKAFIENKNLKFVSIPNKKNLEYCRIYRYSSFPPHTKVIVRGEIESDSD